MKSTLLPILALLALAGPACAAETQAAPDLSALIECRAQIEDFLALAPTVHDPLKAVALGWKPLPQSNQFMTEFELIAPIRVFGHGTNRIAFSGEGIVAVLDLPDPRPLAHELQLETAIDTPQKAMFGKEVHGVEITDPQSGKALYESAVLNVANVDSHPGKTLAGCSYARDLMEDDMPEDGTPEDGMPEQPVEAAPAVAAPST
ncbi:MAG: hypothetical protein QM769_09395 [Pseudoxanthomonas sp.]